MFKNIYKLMFVILVIVLFNSNITEAQTTSKKKVEYPVFSINPVGGAQFPIGGLNDSYGASFNAGVDLCLRINGETAFYLNAAYFDMPKKSDILVGPSASYIAITAGPRYFFTSKSIKALFFLEAGIGVYILNTKEYSNSGTPSLGVTIPSTSTAIFGVNSGPGVIIPLGTSMDLVMKTKLHFMSEKGGDRIFISTIIGLNFSL